MRVEISKVYEFSAAHHLEGLPPEHKCAGNHGHSYSVEVCLSSMALDSVGFVLDYGELDKFMKPLIDHPTGLDHTDLNERLGFNPTAERIAIWFLKTLERTIHALNDGNDDADTWIRIAWIRVKEGVKSAATVYPT